MRIYEAYRIRISRLSEAVQLIHDYQTEQLYQWFKGLADSVVDENPTDSVMKLIEVRIKNNNDNILCGFKCWVSKKHAYIIPYGQSLVNCCPDWFEKYDLPHLLPTKKDKRQYDIREKKWKKLCAFDGKNCLTYQTVCSLVDVEKLKFRWLEENA